jgi:hypothetical protein
VLLGDEGCCCAVCSLPSAKLLQTLKFLGESNNIPVIVTNQVRAGLGMRSYVHLP